MQSSPGTEIECLQSQRDLGHGMEAYALLAYPTIYKDTYGVITDNKDSKSVLCAVDHKQLIIMY